MKEKIIIKKYSNRRLYDMELKRYITLDELKDRIQGGLEVQVLDSKTGEDLTQAVLIQLILETQKSQFNGLFTSELLHQLIQYREQSLTEFFQKYLPNIMSSYIEWQQEAQNHFLHWAKLGWSANQYSREFFMPSSWNFWGAGKTGAGQSAQAPINGDETPSEAGNPSSDSEIAFLKQRITELESRLKNSPKES